MNRPSTTVQARVRRVRKGSVREEEDALAVEEPLEIRIVEPRSDGDHEHALSVTMRTPGHDFELAAGFLLSEGVLRAKDEIARIEYCVPGAAPQEYNIVRVVLRDGLAPDLSRTLRAFFTTSACGVCGKATLEAVKIREPPTLPQDRPRVREQDVAAWPDALRARQGLFDRTGGLHAAALFRGSTIVSVREDVGRHNAVDKLVGEQFLGGAVPLLDAALLVSGRASFEILQKALAAGIPFVAAVGAPSSLAVRTAEEFGMTLVGFLRGESFNVYAGSQRIA